MSCADWKSQLQNMTDEEFASYIAAVRTKLQDRPKTLSDQTKLYVREIEPRTYQFDRREKLLARLSNITKSVLVRFCDRHLFSHASRKRLSVQQFSAHSTIPTSLDNFTIIGDSHAFKAQMALYPWRANVNDLDKPIDEMRDRDDQDDIDGTATKGTLFSHWSVTPLFCKSSIAHDDSTATNSELPSSDANSPEHFVALRGDGDRGVPAMP
jgi:hypothetical protein